MDEQATGSWLTYAELGTALGISAEAARAVARRHKWPRQQANAVGRVVRVLVPADRIRPDSANGQSKNGHRPNPDSVNGYDGTSQQMSPDSANGQTDNGQWPNPNASGRDLEKLAEIFLRPVCEQLDRERERADRAEAQLAELRGKFESELIEHRRIVGTLTEQLAAARRPWWRRWR